MAVVLPNLSVNAAQLAELAKAVAVLDELLPEFDVRFVPRVPVVAGKSDPSLTTSAMNVAPSTSQSSKRDLVKRAAAATHRTVDEIATDTNLDKKDIRGVLNAPDLVFDVQETNDGKRYLFTGTQKRSRSQKSAE